jgi:formylmethanofuran dehydrogenase subunit B
VVQNIVVYIKTRPRDRWLREHCSIPGRSRESSLLQIIRSALGHTALYLMFAEDVSNTRRPGHTAGYSPNLPANLTIYWVTNPLHHMYKSNQSRFSRKNSGLTIYLVTNPLHHMYQSNPSRFSRKNPGLTIYWVTNPLHQMSKFNPSRFSRKNPGFMCNSCVLSPNEKNLLMNYLF